MVDAIAIPELPLAGDHWPRCRANLRNASAAAVLVPRIAAIVHRRAVIPGVHRAAQPAGARTRRKCVAAGSKIATRLEPSNGWRARLAAAFAPRASASRDRGAETGRSTPVEHELEVEGFSTFLPVHHQQRPLHQLRGDLQQEARWDGQLAHAAEHPPRGMREVQPSLGPRDPDVGESALLLQLLLVVERSTVREEAFLEAGDEHDRELETLGSVEGDERDRVGLAFVGVLVCDESGLLQEAVEGVLRRQVVVARGDLAQLEQVRPAFLAVLRSVG